jgi:DNA-binding response OmpR family regulator
MSDILNYIEANPQETKRLIGLEYEQLQQLIQNAERPYHQKQELRKSWSNLTANC